MNETEENLNVILTAKVSYGTYESGDIEFEIEVRYILDEVEEYYLSITATSGNLLKLQLRTLISETHKLTTSYSSLLTYLQEADEDPNNPNNMLLFYTGQSVPKTSSTSVWNREHVWPKSLGWFTESGAGADMHHLRPCMPNLNSSRSNDRFGLTSEGAYFYPVVTDSKYNGTGIDYRGDVARIIFYMFVRYEQADQYTFIQVGQYEEIFLEWNEIDPVSETEIIRNDYTYQIQGNRNPFIDYPEYAEMIWG